MSFGFREILVGTGNRMEPCPYEKVDYIRIYVKNVQSFWDF